MEAVYLTNPDLYARGEWIDIDPPWGLRAGAPCASGDILLDLGWRSSVALRQAAALRFGLSRSRRAQQAMATLFELLTAATGLFVQALAGTISSRRGRRASPVFAGLHWHADLPYQAARST